MLCCTAFINCAITAPLAMICVCAYDNILMYMGMYIRPYRVGTGYDLSKYAHPYTYVYIYVYTYIYIFTYTYIYIYIYM